MAYISKNPKLDSTILLDQGVSTPANPPASNYKLIVRSGSPYIRDSSGAEKIAGVIQPTVFTFDAWNPSDLVGTDTNASSRTIQQAGNAPVSISTISAGTVTITFNSTRNYMVNVSSSMGIGAVTVEAYVLCQYAGTATNYANLSSYFSLGLPASGGDSASTSDIVIVPATATQTMTIKAFGRVNGTGSTATRTFKVTVSIIPL